VSYGARKTVTIVFVDVVESARLGASLDPEDLRHLMLRYFETVAEVLRCHGATVEKFIGDAVMAVFGVPVVHEDDALRAVRAAVGIGRAVDELNAALVQEGGFGIEIRTGVNTGEVFAGGGSEEYTFVSGDAVNAAARLQQAAGPGEILIGEATRGLVRDAVVVERVESVTLRGAKDIGAVWRLEDVLDTAVGLSRRLDSPLVGRGRELVHLRVAFDRAVEDKSNYLFTILGPAGIGKSRLAAELSSMLAGSARIVAGRCLPYGEGITFWPLREIVQDLAADDPALPLVSLLGDDSDAEAIAARIDAAIGRTAAAGTPQEAFWAVRKLFEALARERPLVVVLEDLHWAEPTFLDLVDHVADWSRDAPILLLCLARPELLEMRPDWGGGKLNSASLTLEPLTQPEADALIDNLLGENELAPNVRTQIANTAEGNPLFVEQMLALVEEAGGDGELEVPPTIQSLLAARLDHLGDAERLAIERASVVGTRCWAGAVAELMPAELRDLVPNLLSLLVRKGLLRPDRPVVPGEEGYRLQHGLIRDAAYAAIPKQLRADLHERFATFIEVVASDRLTEVEEIVGYHLEQAFQYRSEFGDQPPDLAARAAGRLGAAGRRALGRGDISAGANLLSRTVALLPPDAPERLQLLPALGGALTLAGELAQAEGVLSEAIDAAAALGDRRIELRARLEHAFLQSLTNPAASVERLLDVAEHAIPELESLGDDAGLAQAWRRVADVYWLTNRWEEQERALERALPYAERAGDAREAGSILMRLAMALYWGPVPAPEAIERAEQTLERVDGNGAVESTFLVSLGGLSAMSGRFDEARSRLARGRRIAGELGFTLWFAGFSLISGDVELLAGDPAAGERELREGYEVLERMGERGILSTVATRLARTIYAQGRYDEAGEFASIGEQLAGTGDVASQIEWRAVRAKVLARRGELEGAESLGREALRLAEQTDDINGQATVLMDLAEVLDLAGERDAALSLVRRARELFEQKGNVVAARAAEATLARVGA
jgi:class 3 adenylate cyclase/tetratricopeptide (TPR) repeat protein